MEPTNNTQSHIRVALPMNPTLNGCDYCYRPARRLVPVAVVPHLGRPGEVCQSCHQVMAER